MSRDTGAQEDKGEEAERNVDGNVEVGDGVSLKERLEEMMR